MREGLHLRRSVLRSVLLIALPTALLFFMGRAKVGGSVFWLLFLACAIRYVFRRKADELLALLIGVAPFMNLLRDFAFYNVVAVVFFLGVAYFHRQSPETLPEVARRFPIVVPFLGFISLYYAISLLLTRDYSINFRFFELAFGVLAMLVVARDRAALGAALTGLLVSATLVGTSMLPHLNSVDAQRLGIVEVEGLSLGNPVQLGLPLALSFLALTVDRGTWLRLGGRWVRAFAQALTFGLLVLTTSRAAWLIVALAAVVVLLLGRGQRLLMVAFITGGLIAVQLLRMTPYREGLEKGLERTFSEERSAVNRTSGRSDQWIVTSRALTASTSGLIHGSGPGLGAEAYARFSKELSQVTFAVGEEIALHSLYMQVAVETGLLGLCPLMAGLLYTLFKGLAWAVRRRLLLPLVAFLGYVSVALTVSGNDTISAAFLGLGFLATMRQRNSAAKANAAPPDQGADLVLLGRRRVMG